MSTARASLIAGYIAGTLQTSLIDYFYEGGLDRALWYGFCISFFWAYHQWKGRNDP